MRKEEDCAVEQNRRLRVGAVGVSSCTPKPKAFCTAVFTDAEHVTWECFGNVESCQRYWPGTPYMGNVKQSECSER